jgi:hypothetical protein
MIEPLALDELALAREEALKELAYTVNGIRYFYECGYETLSMYESVERFEQWCFEDIMYNKGEFADRREVVA